jgi:transcriptional regulator with XRE-family HTH domain
MNLAQRVRHLRRERGWTQKALAARAGVQHITICRIERSRDTSRVSVKTLMLLADALGVSTDHLLGRDLEDFSSSSGHEGRSRCGSRPALPGSLCMPHAPRP